MICALTTRCDNARDVCMYIIKWYIRISEVGHRFLYKHTARFHADLLSSTERIDMGTFARRITVHVVRSWFVQYPFHNYYYYYYKSFRDRTASPRIYVCTKKHESRNVVVRAKSCIYILYVHELVLVPLSDKIIYVFEFRPSAIRARRFSVWRVFDLLLDCIDIERHANNLTRGRVMYS